MYQHAHRPEPPAPRSLPRWAVWAFAPAALALGLVVGVAASAYGPWAAPAEEIVVPAPPEQEPSAPADAPSPPSPWQGPGPGDPSDPDASTAAETAVLLPPPVDDATYTVPAPSAAGPAVAEVRTLVEARTVLASEFSTFTAGGREWFHVDYQLARDINYDTMLVGIIKIAEYNNWLTAAQDYEDELTRWLTAAARRVRDAAASEGFKLSWALFEVVPDRPFGFLASEVTPLPRGEGYLVTRPLAAVSDFAGPSVTIAAFVGTGTGPVTNPSPAMVYGPVLRFDPTDLYRPPMAPSR